MNRLFRQLTTPLAKKSSFFYFGSLIISFGRYLFHLLLLRFLTPQSYGEFLSYVSFLYLLTIPSSTIGLLVNRYVSTFYGQKDNNKINTFFYYVLWRTLLPAAFIFILVSLFANTLSTLLKANPVAFLVLGVMTIFSFLGAIIRSYLTALQRFYAQVVIGALELLSLLFITFIFLNFGFQAVAGVYGMLLSSALGISLTFYLIRSKIFPQQSGHPQVKLRSFLLYSLIFSAGTMSLISTDILLTRYFFSLLDSGLYSALSVIGRMIFFGLTPLSNLVIPIAASRHANKKSTFTVYLKLVSASVLFGSIAVGIFTLLPRLVVTILSGSQYLTIIPLVPHVSLTMFIFALNYLTLSYFLAIEKTSSTYILLAFTLFQPILIYLYHQSIYQVVTLNLTLQICLFLSLLIYYKVSSKHAKTIA